MDLSVIFQLRNKKFWWMDVIFYFVISLLIATVLCYVIFLVKNNFQRQDIKKENAALQTVGTAQQKKYETEVVDYKGKITDFASLFKNHEFASNVFAFMQAQTMPNVWFKQFSLDEKNNKVQLSGEAEDMDAFSRQIATFEKNEYVSSVGSLSSSIGASARTQFNIDIVLEQKIFDYLSKVSLTPAEAEAAEEAEENAEAPVSTNQTVNQTSVSGIGTDLTSLTTGSESPTKSSEKLITSFHFILNPEVAGLVDQTNYAITLRVPYGTDVTNLISSIVISPGASVMPESGEPQDFSSPVTYTVTAQDGSVQSYKVSAVINAKTEAIETTGQANLAAIIVTVLVGIAIVAIAVIFFIVWRKKIK